MTTEKKLEEVEKEEAKPKEREEEVGSKFSLTTGS